MNEIATWVTVLRALLLCAGVVVLAWRMPRREFGSTPAVRLAWRVAPLAVLAACVVAEKLVGLRFYFDLPVVVLLVAAYLYVTRRVGARNGVYAGTIVFLCSDLATALANSLYLRMADVGGLGFALLAVALYAAVMLGSCAALRRFAPTDASAPIKLVNLLVLLLALAPYIVLRSSPLVYGIEGDTGILMEAVLALTIVATLGTFVGNYNAVRVEVERARRLELEMELQKRQRRYEIRKETLAEVNRRYHDMVKYARMFEAAGSPGKLDDYLEERMTENLAAETLQETGNPVVDMVLWEAGETCREQGIRLVPNIDALEFGTIAPYDLHTILGNALDNAVEAASRVTEPDKREVRLRVTCVNRMLFVKVSNCFAGELRRDGDRLLTTKEGEGSGPHGYGVENIRRAAESYGGSMLIDVDGDEFTLTAMVPLE